MRRKDDTVELEIHWYLTHLLILFSEWMNGQNEILVITSGSESGARHSRTSLHFALPGGAIDLRSWDFKTNSHTVSGKDQAEAYRLIADNYADSRGIPRNWFDIVVERDHIHVEFQPKREEF